MRVIFESISPAIPEMRRDRETTRCKEIIVKLSAEERERLNGLIQKGKAPVRQALKAHVLLKADASDAGAAWSDGQIAEALDTSVDTVARTRQQLVEGGLDATLLRKHSPKLRQVDRRIPDKPMLIEEVTAWEEDRNNNHTKADWQLTTADARIKLKRLYPAL